MTIFSDPCAGNGNVRFEFEAPIGVLLLQVKENLLNVAARFVHGNIGRDTHV
jgi:hypothetical protein